MRIPIPTLVAIIGLFGIIVGGLIQAAVARTNRRHERRLALEIKRAEERISLYGELVKYILEMERTADRTMGVFSRINSDPEPPPAVCDEIKFKQPKQASFISDELAARLTIFGSPLLNLLFSCWRCDYHRVDQARELKKIISSFTPSENGGISPEDEADLDRASRIANERAAMFADRLVRQMQAELAGESSFASTNRKIRRYFLDRRETRKKGLNNEFMENTFDRITPKVTDALQSISEAAQRQPTRPLTAGEQFPRNLSAVDVTAQMHLSE